ncbi:acyl-CoA dehydrogenase family protein [Saccharothrix australiensis]|uniref:Alkylation response protein AidB-like acyl-CoA dehydrogenase n=1 Tax=Saccharothrix australiensis TaxID=2072 RepID=A0A495W1S5_9PSEU|nr:acyl-CoA dehydrogenase family protein [Saccharothrix australiensis]RKT55641.1 alkylation response protein AidB-like acyl-CoA dehydrogenase [Saccharothrix australiensis]
MEFSWTPAQERRYRETAEAVAAAFPGPDEPRFSRAAWRRLGEIGLLGACVPEAYGGRGLGALDTALVFEAAGRATTATGVVFAAAAHLFACAVPIAGFGAPALREGLLPGMCSGELVGGNAMTEPGAGSDVSALATTAVPAEGGYTLSGTKSFVSNGPVADVYVTYAVTDPTAGHLGTSAFAVAAGTPGVRAGAAFDKLGMAGCEAGPVVFDGCSVPAGALLGEPGQGGAVFQHSMAWERSCLFALFLGVQDALVERCVAHVRQRRQFGRRLAEFQAVSHRIAEMKLRLEGSRLLLYRACWELDEGRPAASTTALAKLAVSESALASATDAVRLFGAGGYLAGHGIEAALRDAVGGVTFSGTSDVQRQLVAMELGL